jgi:hypothetical protein
LFVLQPRFDYDPGVGGNAVLQPQESERPRPRGWLALDEIATTGAVPEFPRAISISGMGPKWQTHVVAFDEVPELAAF